MTPPPNPDAPAPVQPDAQPLCMSCLFPNHPADHFCAKCGAPLTSYAATAPFESAFAKGHAYRQATEKPRRLIVVLGMWMIFGPIAGGGITMIVLSAGDPLQTIIGLGMSALSGAIIAKTTWNYCVRKAGNSQPK